MVEQNAAIAAAARNATTDEAFAAFDCMNEEVPASTLHLISKYSCDTPPTHTFLDRMMAMQEQNDLEFPFLSTGEKYCWVAKDKNCSSNFTILRHIFLMLPNAPYKFRNGNCASYFYFQPFIFVGDGKFSHWNSTLSTDTHTCEEDCANTNNKIISTCFLLKFEQWNGTADENGQSGEARELRMNKQLSLLWVDFSFSFWEFMRFNVHFVMCDIELFVLLSLVTWILF